MVSPPQASAKTKLKEGVGSWKKSHLYWGGVKCNSGWSQDQLDLKENKLYCLKNKNVKLKWVVDHPSKKLDHPKKIEHPK